MRTLVVLLLASTMGGCATFASHPEVGEYPSLSEDTVEVADQGSAPTIAEELQVVRARGDTYLGLAKKLYDSERNGGAFLFGGGLYGAAVTAFNPAPKNLLAAILGVGVGQAWRTALKPGERAKVYAHGYRAMSCVNSAGRGLLQQGPAEEAQAVRNTLAGYLIEAETVRAAAGAPGAKHTATHDADLALLDQQIKELGALDDALRIEVAAIYDAPSRIGRVRRQIEGDVDKRLDQQAPDYAAALKLMGETAKPAAAPAPTPTPAPLPPQSTKNAPRGPTLAEEIRLLPARIGEIRRNSPTQAAAAYDQMGKCIELLG